MQAFYELFPVFGRSNLTQICHLGLTNQGTVTPEAHSKRNFPHTVPKNKPVISDAICEVFCDCRCRLQLRLNILG